MRTTRRATHVVASAAALTAVLALTACQNDTKDTGSPAPSASSQSAAGGQGAPSPSDGKGPAEGGHASKTAAAGAAGNGNAGKKGSGQPSGQGSGSRTTTVACTGAHVKVTVTKVKRPLNHMLLTATNTGSAPCNAYGAPYLRWDDAQAATTFLEASKPQAVVTLAPGESAYAGIMYQSADGSGNSGHTARTLGVLFGNRAGNGSTGPAVQLPLPNGGVLTDSSAWVTYWQSRAQDALTW
ncbi:DUF4232 domain-containing protein [Streptomyces decoyicus]|uniref:DUF4232 domain-containing protein n=1 Tax=Streptomyces decoyicus TaxID=249567 RepID=UPI0004ABC168|nr:DUF4232 domain-containing protein [Streptomyces decoyicus]KOG44952.1 hypothetical protein ADK74_13595 [Streptomyces decoyicus]QZY19631.1 DUF4232 domain-containing protein [Streptomyces decoyicus]